MENFSFIFGIKNIRHVLITLVTISILMSSCQWEPPHSNPWDPEYDSPSLSFQVMSLGIVNQVAVEGATVQIEELNLYATTDSNGTAYFEKIGPGSWMVVAFRQGVSVPDYKTDSMLVTVSPGSHTAQSIRLDALPYFAYAKVNVHSFEVSDIEEPEHEIRLKAKVIDSDGEFDLSRVEWRFKDVSGILNYNQDTDSAFHEIILHDIPSLDFPYELGLVQLNSFYFEAFDQLGNSSIDSAKISRIIDVYPTQRTAYDSEIGWWYFWDRVFNDITEFNYLLRIYEFGTGEVVYDTTMIHDGEFQTIEHQIATPLAPGNYNYHIWVTDNYGNYVRTSLETLVVFPTVERGEYKREDFLE